MQSNKDLAVYQTIGKQIMVHKPEQALRLPQAQLMVLYFLISSIFVKVYKPLLHVLSIIGKLVFYLVTVYVTGIVTLCHFSLTMSSVLQLIIVKKLRREVLAPAVQVLWHSLAAVRNFGFYLASALQYYAARWVLKLLFSLLKQETLASVSSGRHQRHHSTHPFLQENSEAYQTLLRPIMKQIAIALFLGFLDGVQEAFCFPIQVVKCVLSQLYDYCRPTQHSSGKDSISEDITCILPGTYIPLSRRFKCPATSIRKDIPPSFAALKFVVATEPTVSGLGRYGLDLTNIPLHVRFQNNIRMINECSAMQEKDSAAKWIKASCAIVFTLYLSMISNIIKNIR